MIAWGINALNHGSSIAIFENNQLVDYVIFPSDELDTDSINYFQKNKRPSIIYWYEKPWLKKIRQIRAGQWYRAVDLSVLPTNYLRRINLVYDKIIYTQHHASHAAAGYYTCPFDGCAVVVLDAIGEFESASIWNGQDGNLVKVWNRNYPNSLGLFYSAFTQLLGFIPVLEESKFTELSSLGDPHRFYQDVQKYFKGKVDLKENFHKGIKSWSHPIESDRDRQDVAAAVQKIFEDQVDMVMETAKILTGKTNLVYMGGCAMNRKYNHSLSIQWDKIWSLPNPGDPSSAVGAVLYHTKKKVSWSQGVVKHLEIKL
jgi:carbamoyltransferase